jgi:hypothetical protein
MGGIGMGKTAVKRFHCRLPARPGLLFSAGFLRRGGLAPLPHILHFSSFFFFCFAII